MKCKKCDGYKEWLTEMLITHGVDREHKWESFGADRLIPNKAIALTHLTWRGVKLTDEGIKNGWHLTQKAVEYLKEQDSGRRR